MQRIPSVELKTAQGRTRELLDTVRQAFGAVPNATRVMANSPAVLDSFLAFSTAMDGARIGKRLHNQVKLMTSESNACEYCTSILSAVAPSASLSASDVLAGRTGNADDARTRTALGFAHDVLENRGKVGDQQIAAVRQAGFTDGEIVEIVASVVLGCFTNFLNNVARTDLEFPKAEPVIAGASCGAGACSGN